MNRFLALTLLICLLFSSVKIIQAQVPDGEGGFHEKWEFVLEDTGDVLQLAIPLSGLAATIATEDWEGTKQLALSFGSSFLLTHGLKRVIRKQRPEGRHLFDAFPSGHTSSAFSGASFIQRRYGWKYGKYAYILASIVAVSRMEGPDGWHDFWDVLAGAAVGIGTTYIFTTPKYNEGLSLGFRSGKNGFLVSLKFEF